MKEEKTTPLRQRMIEDMQIRGLCEKTQQGHIRCVKHFAAFLGRSPDTATADDLRAYQLQMAKDAVSAPGQASPPTTPSSKPSTAASVPNA